MDSAAWFPNALEVEIVWLSLRVAVTAVVFSLPAGLVCAWILARWHFPGKSLFDGLIHLPLVLPPVVVGYALLVWFGANGAIGRWLASIGIDIAFTWRGAALASAVMAFPLMVRAIRLSFEAMDPRLEAAARTLGASKAAVFLTVSLPLALPGIITGSLLAFARSLGEFGATITFVSNIPGETRTLPLAIYTLINMPDGEAAAFRLAAIAVAVSLGAVIVSEAVARRLRRARHA